MYVIYCDGSIKNNSVVVAGIIVAKLSDVYSDRVQSVTYLHKNTFQTYYKENLHELFSCLEAIKVMGLLEITKEKVIIVNDSVADVIIMNGFKEKKIDIYSRVKNKDLLNLLKEIEGISLESVEFQRMPRTTLGINVADFLNKEPKNWINEKEKPFLEIQIKKMLNRPFDYNISSKNKIKI